MNHIHTMTQDPLQTGFRLCIAVSHDYKIPKQTIQTCMPRIYTDLSEFISFNVTYGDTGCLSCLDKSTRQTISVYSANLDFFERSIISRAQHKTIALTDGPSSGGKKENEGEKQNFLNMLKDQDETK